MNVFSAALTVTLALAVASVSAQTPPAAGCATVEIQNVRPQQGLLHPQRVGLPTRWLLTGAGGPVHPGRENFALLHGVQLLDLHTGRARRHDYGAHVIAEEHVIVPKPGKTGELDAWLLGTTFDARRQATVLNLLDAAHIEDGPVAQAVLPYALPLGFHGNFTAA